MSALAHIKPAPSSFLAPSLAQTSTHTFPNPQWRHGDRDTHSLAHSPQTTHYLRKRNGSVMATSSVKKCLQLSSVCGGGGDLRPSFTVQQRNAGNRLVQSETQPVASTNGTSWFEMFGILLPPLPRGHADVFLCTLWVTFLHLFSLRGSNVVSTSKKGNEQRGEYKSCFWNNGVDKWFWRGGGKGGRGISVTCGRNWSQKVLLRNRLKTPAAFTY